MLHFAKRISCSCLPAIRPVLTTKVLHGKRGVSRIKQCQAMVRYGSFDPTFENTKSLWGNQLCELLPLLLLPFVAALGERVRIPIRVCLPEVLGFSEFTIGCASVFRMGPPARVVASTRPVLLTAPLLVFPHVVRISADTLPRPLLGRLERRILHIGLQELVHNSFGNHLPMIGPWRETPLLLLLVEECALAPTRAPLPVEVVIAEHGAEVGGMVELLLRAMREPACKASRATRGVLGIPVHLLPVRAHDSAVPETRITAIVLIVMRVDALLPIV